MHFTLNLVVSTVHVIFKVIPNLVFHAPYKLSFSILMVWILNPLHPQILSAVSSIVSFNKTVNLLFSISVLLNSVMDINRMSQIQVQDFPFSWPSNPNHVNTSHVRYYRGISEVLSLFMYKIVANVISHLLTNKKRFLLIIIGLMAFSSFLQYVYILTPSYDSTQ